MSRGVRLLTANTAAARAVQQVNYLDGQARLRLMFVENLCRFMSRRGTPLERLPVVGGVVLDLCRLFREVRRRGGMVVVSEGKKWSEVSRSLEYEYSFGAAIKAQYEKILYAYELHKAATEASSGKAGAEGGATAEGGAAAAQQGNGGACEGADAASGGGGACSAPPTKVEASPKKKKKVFAPVDSPNRRATRGSRMDAVGEEGAAEGKEGACVQVSDGDVASDVPEPEGKETAGAQGGGEPTGATPEGGGSAGGGGAQAGGKRAAVGGAEDTAKKKHAGQREKAAGGEKGKTSAAGEVAGKRKGPDAEEVAGGAGAGTGAGAGAGEEAEAQWEAAFGAAL